MSYWKCKCGYINDNHVCQDGLCFKCDRHFSTNSDMDFLLQDHHESELEFVRQKLKAEKQLTKVLLIKIKELKNG